MELIRDPSVVEEKIRQLQAQNPAQKQQQRKLKNLNAILREQETFRNNLAAEMRKKAFSERTVAFLNTQLTMLEQQEEEARRDLADEQRMQQQYEQLHIRIAEFHQQCQVWKEQLDNSEFIPSFQFKLDALLFFGISVKVRKIKNRLMKVSFASRLTLAQMIPWFVCMPADFQAFGLVIPPLK